MNTVSCNDETVAVSKRQLASTTTLPDSTHIDPSTSCVTLGREHFQHKQEVLHLVTSMLQALKTKDTTQARLTAQTLVWILDQYQEDSVLLDPYVPEIAGPLVAVIADQVLSRSMEAEHCRLPSSVLFILAKVCGYRSMSASGVFPHSFNYLDPLVCLLSEGGGGLSWELRFVLLLWLSVLLLLPFNLSIVMAGGASKITSLAMTALGDSTQSVSKAGALVLGRLLSRDVQLIHKFIGASEGGLGVLETLNQTLKMLPSKLTDQELISKLFAVVSEANKLTIAPGAEVRAKVLRVRIAAKLLHDVDQRHEAFMTEFLADRDYVVRWAAAKGLGRVGGVHTLVSLLKPQHNINDALLFQGRSLAVAELLVRSTSSCSRWKFAPPVRGANGGEFELYEEEEVVTLACTGLEHPTTSSTWQVRDAASYIIWALARTLVWTPRSIEEVFKEALLPALLTVCLFDREISCRRVAAAALQELVGRIGTKHFAAGMALIQTVDFWAVADLKQCFEELTVEVLKLVDLRSHFIEHLLSLKLVHPSDKELRTLAARTLTKIINKEHDQFVDAAVNKTVLNGQVPVTARQGGLEFLTAAASSWQAEVWRSNEGLQTAVRNVVPRLEKERLYRGKGGEMIRIAACRLIEALARNTNITFKPATSERYLQTVLEGLRHLVAGVQVAAAKALVAITQHRGEISPEIFNKLKAILNDKNENVAARRGAVLGLAFLAPDFADKLNFLQDLVDILKTEALAWPSHPLGVPDFVDAEARKFAVVGLVRIATASPRYRPTAISVCQAACEDFQVDQRGDVGSWVREVAINGLSCLAPLDAKSIEVLVARACERLDRIRGLAALRVHGLVNGTKLNFADLEACLTDPNANEFTSQPSPSFSESVDLALQMAVTSAFVDPPKDRPELSTARSAWSSSPCVFRRCCGLLTLPTLQLPLMRALVGTVGGVTAESVGEAARSELLLASAGVETVARLTVSLLTGDLARVASRQERNNRLITPVFNTLAFLLREDVGLLKTLSVELSQTVVPRVSEEIRGSRDVHKLRAACALLLECYQMADALRSLVHDLLNSPFPSIRHGAASGLYLKLVDDDMDEAADLLATTDWAPVDSFADDDAWKQALNQLCALLNLDVPTRESTPHERSRTSTKLKTKETPAYAELVKDEHW